MSTYLLIHGAQHGAWSWDLLVPRLRSMGHTAIAMDLPVDDPSAGLEVYASTVIHAASAVDDDDVVVVGHSMAGMVAPIVATRRPTRAVVYLAGVVPVPGLPMSQVLLDEPDLEQPRIRDQASTLGKDGLRYVSPEVGREIYYHDCPPDVAAWASARLRPTADTAAYDVSPLERFPEVKTVSIVCCDDRVVNPEWSRRVAQARLGIDCVELPGGHAPMVSRPEHLAQVLAAV